MQNKKSDNDIPESVRNNRSALVHTVNRGEFWKPCPGTTKGYYCCGYQIITPLTGCGMYCAYCILQVYFDHQCQVVYDNFDDLQREIETKMARRDEVLRFGTGEFGDSLFQEPNLGLSRKIAEVLSPYPNVLVEFKTKSTNISTLKEIKHPEKVIIGFSLNTPRNIEVLEAGTALLDERLEAAMQCIEMGFYVAFHFDPMVYYTEWESHYREVVRRIFDFVKDTQRIAWVSCGGFRSMPTLKTELKKLNNHLPLFTGEMILGEDGKLRYFRPIRAAFYRAMDEEFTNIDESIPFYLCMESPELWEESGMARRIPNGLPEYLDKSAKRILGL